MGFVNFFLCLFQIRFGSWPPPYHPSATWSLYIFYVLNKINNMYFRSFSEQEIYLCILLVNSLVVTQHIFFLLLVLLFVPSPRRNRSVSYQHLLKKKIKKSFCNILLCRSHNKLWAARFGEQKWEEKQYTNIITYTKRSQYHFNRIPFLCGGGRVGAV